jgi:hypothetical protein
VFVSATTAAMLLGLHHALAVTLDQVRTAA